jgi:hypothetical protein
VSLARVRCARASALTDRYSTRSLQITRNSVERAIAHAQADDLVGRNVVVMANYNSPLWTQYSYQRP